MFQELRALNVRRLAVAFLTLADLGYADYDGKFFTLSPRILRLGHSYLSSTPLPRLVQPFLDQLSEKTGESASASVLDGNEIVYIARASHKRVMSINLNPGSRLPAYCSSMGRVLLAAMPEDEARHILEGTNRTANTPKTKTAIVELLDELQRVRVQGYAVIDQELEIGLCSIAIPVRNMRGATVAAINIGTQAVRVTIDQMVDTLSADDAVDARYDHEPAGGIAIMQSVSRAVLRDTGAASIRLPW